MVLQHHFCPQSQRTTTSLSLSQFCNIIVRDVYIHTDVAPSGACRPWIFSINGVLCFLKINGSGMEKEKDDWRRHFKEKMSQEEAMDKSLEVGEEE